MYAWSRVSLINYQTTTPSMISCLPLDPCHAHAETVCWPRLLPCFSLPLICSARRVQAGFHHRLSFLAARNRGPLMRQEKC